MKLISANLNGIRAASRKGFWDWFADQDADILCLQELKAHEHQIPDIAKPEGYHCYYHCAEKPGYAGVALYSRREPDEVYTGLYSLYPNPAWHEFDREGRFIMLRFGKLCIASTYFLSGSNSPLRQAKKLLFLEMFLPLMQRLKIEGFELMINGDLNIAHQQKDLKNWRGNRRNSGFLPEERAWLTQWLTSGFVDLFRSLHPEKEQYSWWSNRGNARQNNVGWRIDYHISTPEIAKQVKESHVFTDKWFSDHAPMTVRLEVLRE